MLDHLVVAAATLGEGAAWIESRLGVAPGPGGRHETMGTHNRLLSLGPDHYLEVIAIDPQGRAPERPRWYGLDHPATREHLAKEPALIHWVERRTDLEALAARSREPLDIVPFERGAFRWRLTLTRDGGLPEGGLGPSYIAWEGETPARALADAGIRLLVLGAPDGEAVFETPAGRRTLPWTRLPGRE